QMPRSIDGHGSSKTRYPVTFLALSVSGCSGSPWSSTILAEIPRSGVIGEPGLAAATPGNGEIIAEPVSVCHQVSTTGRLPAPKTSRYQRQASGLIGSATDPSSRKQDRLWASGISRPHFMNVLMRVGAV